MAFATFVHPILQIIPQKWYSTEDGNTLGAILFYTLVFIHNIILYLCDLKYLIIGLERRSGNLIFIYFIQTFQFCDNNKKC